MRASMKALSPIGLIDAHRVYAGSRIEESFRPEEKSGPCPAVERQTECLHQRIDRMIAFSAIVREIAISPFWSKPVVTRNRLEQGGLPRAVLAGKEAYP